MNEVIVSVVLPPRRGAITLMQSPLEESTLSGDATLKDRARQASAPPYAARGMIKGI